MIRCSTGLDTVDLLDKLLILDPSRRITAAAALDHDWFWSDPMPADPKTYVFYSHTTEQQSYTLRSGSQSTSRPMKSISACVDICLRRYLHHPHHSLELRVVSHIRSHPHYSINLTYLHHQRGVLGRGGRDHLAEAEGNGWTRTVLVRPDMTLIDHRIRIMMGTMVRLRMVRLHAVHLRTAYTHMVRLRTTCRGDRLAWMVAIRVAIMVQSMMGTGPYLMDRLPNSLHRVCMGYPRSRI